MSAGPRGRGGIPERPSCKYPFPIGTNLVHVFQLNSHLKFVKMSILETSQKRRFDGTKKLSRNYHIITLERNLAAKNVNFFLCWALAMVMGRTCIFATAYGDGAVLVL